MIFRVTLRVSLPGMMSRSILIVLELEKDLRDRGTLSLMAPKLNIKIVRKKKKNSV